MFQQWVQYITWTEWVGYLAALFTTLSFLPQAWLTWSTKDTSGISLGMYLVFTIGVGLWLLYGLLMQAWPVVVANAITFVLAAFILWLKVRSLRRQAR